MIESILFYLLAAIVLALSLVVITRTNPIASALALVGTFAALAGLYALLSARLAAVIQILVYAGGVMVLIVFVIMILNLHPKELEPMKARGFTVVLALMGTAIVAFGPLFLEGFPGSGMNAAKISPDFGGIFSMGEKIISEYLFPFEMVSLLLLASVVGALVLAKKKL